MERNPPGQGHLPPSRDQSSNSNTSTKSNPNAFQRQLQPRSGQANAVQSEEGGTRGQLNSFSTDNSVYYSEEGEAVQQQQQQGNVPWGNRSIADAGGSAGANALAKRCDYIGYPGVGNVGSVKCEFIGEEEESDEYEEESVGESKSVRCESVEEEEQGVNIKKVRQAHEGWEWKERTGPDPKTMG